MNFTELNNPNDYYNNNQNEYNYWEKPIVEEKPTRKKKVSFNDILSNMNLVVNNQGVLQFMVPNQEELQRPVEEEVLQQNKVPPPTDQSAKHSYIYNKYFKDYAGLNTEKPQPIRVPKTIEEYHQMLLEDKIKKNQHKKMIEQVKSKKMLFISGGGLTSTPDSKRNIQVSMNNLRMMNFR